MNSSDPTLLTPLQTLWTSSEAEPAADAPAEPASEAPKAEASAEAPAETKA